MPDNSGSSDQVAILAAGSVADTAGIARRVAALLRPGDVVLLDGPLGVGKTTFARELVWALGVTSSVTSPTYTLVHEYAGTGGLAVAHVDLYRLETLAELEDLGLDDLGDTGHVLVVEWGAPVAAVFGPDRLDVEIAYGPPDAPTERHVELRPVGKAWAARFADLEPGP